MERAILSHNQVMSLTQRMALQIEKLELKQIKVYPIPRGGIPIAYALRCFMQFTIVDHPQDANLFVDDIIDSGDTMKRYCDEFPGVPFFAIIDKTEGDFEGNWVVFPWEGSIEAGIEPNIVRLLEYVGEDPHRGGLLETPRRVAKAWHHWCGGYGKRPEDILKVFEDGAERYNQMVTVKDIPFYSHCEHHLAPFFGTVTISYIPNGRIVGLSKLSRLTSMFAQRLQVQERLTDQIADAIMENLQPVGVGVIVKARHLCMESRGICQQGYHTITNALRGVMMDDDQARSEFLRLAS